MRNLVVIAVVMLVGSMFVSTFANAADPQCRSTVTGWGTTGQEALADADQQLRDIEKDNPGHWCEVTGFKEGEELSHDPPCWLTKSYILRKSNQ